MKDEEEFLSFKDWINKKEFEQSDWLKIFSEVKHIGEEYNTISILCSYNNEEIIKKALEKSDWLTSYTFGEPFYYNDGADDWKINVYGNEDFFEPFTFEPFLFYRTFHKLYSRKVELVQNFINFYNLYHKPNEGTYTTVDIEGNEITIVKYLRDNDNLEIFIDTRYLRNYLAARNMFIIREHDHRRFSKNKFDKKKINSKDDATYHYNIYVGTAYIEYETISRLLGKDIIKPYNSINHSLIWFSSDFYQKSGQYCEFIVGIDDSGNEVSETSNKDLLSNYFVDRGRVHYLTPVFFKKEVLSKYYNSPSKYFVDRRTVKCLDIWSLQIDENKEGLVYAYLGDLGDLPYNEQLYWKHYNVLPKGKITEYRYKTDFLAEPADPDDLKTKFLNVYHLINDKFHNLYGFLLFRELKKEDEHCFTSLHIPLNNEQSEFDQQILNLAKLLNDSLNKAEFDKLNSQPEKGSISSFEKLLSSKFGVKKGEDLIKPFRILQSIRSSGSAHIKGSGYFKLIKKERLSALNNVDRFRKIMELIYSSLVEIHRLL